MLALIDTCIANSSSRGTCRLILLLLARAANPRGYVRVPARWLSLCSEMSLQTCRESLDHLVAIGELEVVEQGGGKAKATLYRIILTRKHDLPSFRPVPHDL
jgi:hypothetical protein